jgi:hypothetical protein
MTRNITYEMCKTNKYCAESTKKLIKIMKSQKIINNKTNTSMICENNYENTSDKKEHIANDTPEQEEGGIIRTAI